MGEQRRKKNISIGLLAHVDGGKTTLSEGLLYLAGVRRTLGRVDRGDAFLDSHAIERSRGITVFSKQAILETAHRSVTLVDTPGHADLSAEAERVLPILDCAVLLISGTDGIQAHTATLWHLLERYRVPTFLFVNKMDLPGPGRTALLSLLQGELSPHCVDFGEDHEKIMENAALCDEALLENYLESGIVTRGNLRQLIARRKLFPCLFGSALKLEGVEQLLELLDEYAPEPEETKEFSARVFKISRDPQGNRLTWLRLGGGQMAVRSTLSYRDRDGQTHQEKILQIRLYSGDKFESPDELLPGQVAAVTGLTATWAGQSLGAQEQSLPWAMESVMTYRVTLPAGVDPAQALPKLRQLEEEDPQLRLVAREGQIQVQIMGKVQLEVFQTLVHQRFGLDITLDDPKIHYKETILNTVEGVGHFEPLRHYAECHLLLEPLPLGSGLVFDTVCPPDVLDAQYQSLILTHLQEKTHRGVLVGAPITDMKITLLVGKAHLKHTEGGDFRQATYRAVRQGLMQARSRLLEPWYAFRLSVPTGHIGRAITDIRAMGGQFQAPEARGELSVLEGTVPAGEVKDYPQTLAAYTQGRGRLQLTPAGYAPCHDQEAVVAAAGYDPERDPENTPDSVFCAHGAGFNVKWDQVKDYMHLESGLREEKAPVILTRNLASDDRELEKIMEREFGPIRRPRYGATATQRPATEEISIRPLKEKYILVDGYNMIFAWEGLANQARTDLDAARRQLCDRLSSFAGFTKTKVVVVFDGYKQKGNPGEKSRFHNIGLVYTKEGETADAYIEALAHDIGKNYSLYVASSDGLVQLSSLGSGVLRMSARELEAQVAAAEREMQDHYKK